MFQRIKKIRTKVLLPTLAVLFSALLITGATAVYLSYKSTLKTLELTMTETVTLAAGQISAELETYKTLVTELAGVVQDVAPSEVMNLVEKSRQRHGFENLQITRPDGMVGNSTDSVADLSFFTIPREQGVAYISDPLMNPATQTMSIYVAAPILVNGRFDGVVFVGLDAKTLTDMVADIAVGESGDATLINKEGTTIAYKDYSIVLAGYNTSREVAADPSLAGLANMEQAVMAGGTGFHQYTSSGVKNFGAYAPVEDTGGWGMYITVTQAEFLKETRDSLILSVLVTLLFLVLATLLIWRIAGSVSSGVVAVEHAAAEMAKGNYDIDLTYHSQDETGLLADSMRQMMHTTKEIILDTERGLQEVANGNFNITPQVKYIGVFRGIESAMKQIIIDLSKTMSQIKMATQQVSSGSDQVSNGAQALAQGATQQASSIQQLSAAINEISQHIQDNATNANATNILASSAGAGLQTCNAQMSEMIEAMSEISQSSGQISKIIKTIEDIAFQTNILALNAAVEAARAGAAGKGFAVVADEVRNLATKSSEAAKQTNALIEGSVKSVGNGVKIADETAKSLIEVVGGAMAMTELIDKISKASVEQATSIAQINLGVEQISAVVQTNSATSEESAAASQELNGQANMMKQLVDQFQLLVLPGAATEETIFM